MTGNVPSLLWGGLVSLATLAIGCGSDDESEGPNISGMYQVTHHTLNGESCDVEGADVAEPLYFRLERSSIFGFPYYAMDGCTGAEPESCSESLGSFQTPSGNGWRGEIYASSSGTGTGCHLQALLSSAMPTAEVMRIEQRDYAEEDPNLTGDACDPDAAEARKDAMPCSRFEVYEGSLLP